jgi:hypothetical protein
MQFDKSTGRQHRLKYFCKETAVLLSGQNMTLNMKRLEREKINRERKIKKRKVMKKKIAVKEENDNNKIKD